MKFICLNPECKKTFLYTGKLIANDVSIGMNTAPIMKSLETHVCPYCHALDFEEAVETVPIEKIASLKSVSIEEVDALLKEGYEVREVYAKNAILQKKVET